MLTIGCFLLAGTGIARGEDLYVLREVSGFKTKTTEIDRLRLPDPKAVNAVDLKAEWLSARDFRDGAGRTWYLYRGKAPATPPETVSGWVVKSDLGREYFYTKEGLLFGPEAHCPIITPAHSKVTNLPPTKK
jgi:hypothetical protein